jgi:hypothetical protein
MSRIASVHQSGGVDGASGLGSVSDGPCTGDAAKFTLACRADTSASVMLKTVRSWQAVTGPP